MQHDGIERSLKMAKIAVDGGWNQKAIEYLIDAVAQVARVDLEEAVHEPAEGRANAETCDVPSTAPRSAGGTTDRATCAHCGVKADSFVPSLMRWVCSPCDDKTQEEAT